jgi:two-component system phosphate regulon sensor histidine kinase PhoR
MAKNPPENSFDRDIRAIGDQVRLTDFLWAAGLAGGACGIFSIISDVALWQAMLIWGVIVLGLVSRFLTTSVNWFGPVQSAVSEQTAVYQRLSAVLNALPEPVILAKADGTVEMANPATEDFVGQAPEGQHLRELIRTPGVYDALKYARQTGQIQRADFTVQATPADRHCRVYVTPLERQDEEEGDDRFLVFINDLSTERRLQKMRSDFIANASHELRTPLASMLGFIETLRGHAKDDPAAQDKFLGIMESQAERMLRLVKELMSLSAIELNEHVPPEDKVDLLGLAEDVRASLSPVAEKYEGKVTIESLLSGPPMIAGDRDELTQVLQNLTENALKYAGPNASVTVTIGSGPVPAMGEGAQRTGDTVAQVASRAGADMSQLVYVQVRDDGQGIARNDLPRLTERFYRADVEKSRSRGGTGLGLAIVKHIINRHKGGLQIETIEGEGAAFTCYFIPASKAEAVMPAPAKVS